MIESPLLQNITGYAGGQWQQAAADTFDVDNPATGAVIAKVPFVTEQQVQDAIAAAKKAEKLTEPYPLETRRKWLTDIRDALTANRAEMGRILCLNTSNR